MSRPRCLAVVLGTGTEVGKTWVAAAALERLSARGSTVAARKPAQSWDPDDRGGLGTDADRLAAATGESPQEVCHEHRTYAVALAPPMAAERLGQPPIHLVDLVAELSWPEGVDVGLVEAAGGVHSPLAHDGDGADLAHALSPDAVVLVADAGLGVIHAVRASVAALDGLTVVVFLNRFDRTDPLHESNRQWLEERVGLDVVTSVDDLVAKLDAHR